jgi:hypothetical protein
MAEAEVLVLLFDVGLEADLRAFARVGLSSFLVALTGAVCSPRPRVGRRRGWCRIMRHWFMSSWALMVTVHRATNASRAGHRRSRGECR